VHRILWTLLVCSLSATAIAQTTPDNRRRPPPIVFPCDPFVFGTGKTHVATTLDLDPLVNTTRVRFVDAMTSAVLFDEELQQEGE
jgi:hypothetical protein